MSGPLSGLLVIDTSWGLPGSLAGMLLADSGAIVVKLERPGDSGVPTALRRVVERNKWSIPYEAHTAEGAELLHALLTRADVLLDSGRPVAAHGGVVATLGEQHPHLVHCVITGYGLDGPYVDRPGYDSLVAARLGLMAEQRGHRSGPIFLGHPTIPYCAAFLAIIGTLAALHVRRQTGCGQLVDTSLLDGALSMSSMNWWWNERDLSYLAREGDEEGFGRNRLITDPFQCADGRFIMIHTGGEGGFKRTMDLLGLGDQIREVPGLEMSTPLNDEEYHAARHLVPHAFRSRNRDEWIELFRAQDLAAMPMLRPEEIFEDDQIAHAGIVAEVDDPDHGIVNQIGPVVRYHDSPVGKVQPAPDPGQHSAEVAALLERPEAEPPFAVALDVPPLSGLRVLDFSSFFATAFGARLLSDLGADVIKVEPVRGDQMRPLPDLWECAQRGKRSLAIDLRSPQATELIYRLIATADVIMHNQRPGKAEKLGIGYEQCRDLNPHIIYCYLPGFGSSGPKSELKSFAPLVSGFVGLNYIGAGQGNDPVRRVLGNEDLYNGFNGAVSVLMALDHRNRTGRGQLVESPHLHSAVLVRSEQCIDADGHPIKTLQLDADQTGWDALYRLYRTKDGWIALACVGDRAFRRLAGALRHPELADDQRFATRNERRANTAALAGELQKLFSNWTTEAAFRALDAAGVPCEVPEDHPVVPEFLWDEWALDSGRVFDRHHPEYGWIREIGHCLRLAATPLSIPPTSARLGEHSREILEQLGYTPQQVSELLRGPCREPSAHP